MALRAGPRSGAVESASAGADLFVTVPDSSTTRKHQSLSSETSPNAIEPAMLFVVWTRPTKVACYLRFANLLVVTLKTCQRWMIESVHATVVVISNVPCQAISNGYRAAYRRATIPVTGDG
jgi:hypothetical protein